MAPSRQIVYSVLLTMECNQQCKRYVGNSFVMLLNQSKNKDNQSKNAMSKQWLCNDSSFGLPSVAQPFTSMASSGGKVHCLTQADGLRGSHAFYWMVEGGKICWGGKWEAQGITKKTKNQKGQMGNNQTMIQWRLDLLGPHRMFLSIVLLDKCTH